MYIITSGAGALTTGGLGRKRQSAISGRRSMRPQPRWPGTACADPSGFNLSSSVLITHGHGRPLPFLIGTAIPAPSMVIVGVWKRPKKA